jgi:hypothetical protein
MIVFPSNYLNPWSARYRKVLSAGYKNQLRFTNDTEHCTIFYNLGQETEQKNASVPDPLVRGTDPDPPIKQNSKKTSVADPDPYVFGPPGSGSISQSYGSGLGSFYHQAKIERKTLVPTVLSSF